MTVFHYVLRPHGAFSQAAAQRFGVDTQQPLVTALIAPHAKVFAPMLTVTPSKVLVEACHPDPHGGLMVRLYNAGRSNAVVHVAWRQGGKAALFHTGLFGHHRQPLTRPPVLRSLQFITLRIMPR